MTILTPREAREYKKLYRHHRRDHDRAWREFRGVLIMQHPAGWWTSETRADVVSEIAEIEGSVKR